jgi:hypothetical protein
MLIYLMQKSNYNKPLLPDAFVVPDDVFYAGKRVLFGGYKEETRN